MAKTELSNMLATPSLDADQQVAVNEEAPALLVLAGAGSGKTHTIIERAIARSHSPHNIPGSRLLLLTFSRKACNEISERLAVGLPQESRRAQVHTYHAYGYRLVCESPERCRRRPQPTLLDEPDQRRLFKSAARAAGLTGDGFKRALETYQTARNHGLDAEAGAHRSAMLKQLFADGRDPNAQQSLDAFAQYEQRKRAANVLDFHDLQVLPVHALRDDPKWCTEVACRYDELIVDEAQDTNLVQYRMLYLLGKAGALTMTMVGDDDQSIYAWRGAAPDNLRRFQRDFRPVEIHIARNYRSTPEIVNTAARLIAHNDKRVSKKQTHAAGQSNATRPTLQTYNNARDAAQRIAKTIADDIAAGGRGDDHCVLYRVNRLASVLEPALIAHGVPYHIQKATALYRRQEVQMLFAAIRMAINSDDSPAFTKLATLVPGFGEKGINNVLERHRETGATIERAPGLLDIAAEHTRGEARGWWYVLHEGVEILTKTAPGQFDLVDDWIMGIEIFSDWLRKLAAKADDPLENFSQRIDNLALFDRAIHVHAQRHDSAHSAVERWQAVLELTLSTPDEEIDSPGAVTLSTIHKAKGLEWNHVHVFGFSDGLLPAVNDMVDDDETRADSIEEERRLAYVAMTRAARQLDLYHADNIDLPGQHRQLRLSRFAAEAGLVPELHHDEQSHEHQRRHAGSNPFIAAMARSAAPSL